MKDTKIPPYIKSSNPEVSLWQSAVAKVVRDKIQSENPNMTKHEVYQRAFSHPMVLGTNLHVARHKKGAAKLTAEDIRPYVHAKGSNGELHPMVHSLLSQEYFANAKNRQNNLIAADTSAAGGEPWGLPESDYAWLQWVGAAAEWTLYNNHDPFAYITQDPGIITIPDNQRILILGDYGTGLDDGTAMLIAILNNPAVCPDLIIHIGDIYYSGTQDEVEAYVAMFTSAFSAAGKSLPVFSIPGNHEYYSSGAPFYGIALPINNTNFPEYQQKASYFCLQSSTWQLLGMDTGFNSVQVYTALDLASQNYGPWLWFEEAAWHQEKLSTFQGKNILFSHHQLYSVSAVINDSVDVSWANPTDSTTYNFLNANLMNVFSPFFSKISAWFWGHEHSLGIFANNQNGLAVGRLVGNSGYEEWSGQSIYTPQPGNPNQYTQPVVELGTTTVPYPSITAPPNDGGPVSPQYLGTADTDVYNHSFAIMQLNDTDGTASVSYYQYPLLQMLPDSNPADIPVSSLPAIGAPLFTENL